MLKSGTGFNGTKKNNSYMKVSDKGSSQKSTLMKIFSHIPIFSCILCSGKMSKCDDSIIDKKLQNTLALKQHFELYKHPRYIPPDEVSICKRSKISTEVSFNSQSIQFLDDDILDHANYLTHPIYLFH
uniref:BED-type domain-containing protein n=1 Tax=Strongyloides venezuelensis TaxID=75913 RepID=A0A0K0F7A8_STRVS